MECRPLQPTPCGSSPRPQADRNGRRRAARSSRSQLAQWPPGLPSASSRASPRATRATSGAPRAPQASTCAAASRSTIGRRAIRVWPAPQPPQSRARGAARRPRSHLEVAKRRLPGQHVDRAARAAPDVALVAHGLARLEALGRHVAARPPGAPRQLARRGGGLHDVGDAEVGHDEVAEAVEEQVAGLDVARHDARLVQLGERLEGLGRQRDKLAIAVMAIGINLIM